MLATKSNQSSTIHYVPQAVKNNCTGHGIAMVIVWPSCEKINIYLIDLKFYINKPGPIPAVEVISAVDENRAVDVNQAVDANPVVKVYDSVLLKVFPAVEEILGRPR